MLDQVVRRCADVQLRVCCASVVALLLSFGWLSGAAAGADHSVDDGERWWQDHLESGCAHCLAGKLERLEWMYGHELAWDEATGRDLRHFPPDRVVDYLHMTLRMRFENLNDRSFTATETLRFSPIGADVESLTLDAVGLDVHSVTMDDRELSYFQDDETITFNFTEPLVADQTYEVTFDYTCSHPWEGMFFTPHLPDKAPDYTAELHTQGQPESNSHWFICHDFPNERLTTELIVEVPSEYQVSANGRLVSETSENGRSVWHYRMEKPHPNYLVSLVIGTFERVKIPHDRVPMHVWIPPGERRKALNTYGRTGLMVDLFEQRLGYPYPWERYDQLVVKNFGSGGMENTTVTNMYPTAILDQFAFHDGDIEGLIAHELAHQWTGDMITCKSWEHIWLNEGWATYLTAIWLEERDGEEAYLDRMRRNFGVARRDKTTNDLPMVSPIYKNPWETFRRRANPYPKGASILHMLRMMLGEDIFWTGVQKYINDNAFKEVETADFRYALEEVSGLGLEWFFEQWCYRPGTPELDVDVRYSPSSQQLTVNVEQAQKIDADTPAFRFTLPVYVMTESGETTYDIDVREKTAMLQVTLEAPPQVVAIDPWLHVLKTMTVNKPQRLWENQVHHGPTIIARHEAIDQIGTTDTPENIELLSSMVRDRALRYTLQRSAAQALAKYESDAAKQQMRELMIQGVRDARVREAVIRAIADHDREHALQRLVEVAGGDVSYDCRVAAIRGLAKHEATEHTDLLISLVDYTSQHDKVRNAALEALADLDEPRGLELAIDAGSYGNVDRFRTTPIRVVGRLGHHDPDQALEFLLDTLHDPERRPVRAAAEALVDLGDERAIEPLQRLADTHSNPNFRRIFSDQVEALRTAIRNQPEEETTAVAAE